MQSIEQRQVQLVSKALESGVTNEGLSKLVADGMNEGELASVIKGMTFRGSGFSLFLINGEIPAEALDVRIQRLDGEITGTSVGFSELGMQSLQDGTATFSIEQPTSLLPQMGNEPPDWDFLAKLDAHIPSDSSLPPPSL